MAKGSGGKSAVNLLRLSGVLFGVVGSLHLLRYAVKGELIFMGFQLTYFGSLVGGILLLCLSGACFWNSRK